VVRTRESEVHVRLFCSQEEKKGLKEKERERDREKARGLFLSQEKHTPDHNYVFEASL